MPLQGLAKEALGCPRVPAPHDQNIQDVPVPVHRPPQLATFTPDRDVDLIELPDLAKLTMPMAQVGSQGGT